MQLKYQTILALITAALTAPLAPAAPTAEKKAECALDASIIYDASYAYQKQEPLSDAVGRLTKKYTAAKKGSKMTEETRKQVSHRVQTFVSAIYLQAQKHEKELNIDIKGKTEQERKTNAQTAANAAQKTCLEN